MRYRKILYHVKLHWQRPLRHRTLPLQLQLLNPLLNSLGLKRRSVNGLSVPDPLLLWLLLF